MAELRELLVRLDPDHFDAVVRASPKRFREEVFRRAGIRSRAGAFSIKSVSKTEARVKRLQEVLGEKYPLDDEVLEELLRNYLYTRRSLLAEALDFLEVKHEDGLTDEDLEFVEKLAPEKVGQLRDILYRHHEERDVDLYLGFMNVPGADRRTGSATPEI